VEVAPNAKPPVCHIVNFGKFRYEMAKQEKDRRQHTSKVKEVKFRVNISQHDYITKVRHAEEFLDKGNKVKVQLQFRGREMAHQELGMQVMRRVKDDLSLIAVPEMEPRQIGRSINMTLAPLPAGRRKRRFAPFEEGEMPEEDDSEDSSDDEGEE
jgi:translation initiation factor IF-3